MDYSFKIINSSAGSGKTFKLAIEYISKLFSKKNDEHFKSMLALTFTNKASAEMKYRILLYLNDLKYQSNKIVLDEILKITGLDESTIQKRSSTILEKILYNYSNFNVITIDSFTNNIIKTVNAELENKDDFLVEFDNQIYIDQAVEELISEINQDKELKELLVEFAKYKLTINQADAILAMRLGSLKKIDEISNVRWYFTVLVDIYSMISIVFVKSLLPICFVNSKKLYSLLNPIILSTSSGLITS